MQRIRTKHALVSGEWKNDVVVDVGPDGKIASVCESVAGDAIEVGTLLPAPANLHSHSFQRAMAGMTERRGPSGRDTFWTWRKMMFRFLEELTPDDIEAIAAYVQLEMLEAGYATVGEFHYVHHQPNGEPYDDLGELSARIASAAQQSGIGLTLLPVLYQQGGCDGSSLAAGQVRFGNSTDRFIRLFERTNELLSELPEDAKVGVAPHSLRAVNQEGLAACASLSPDNPLHMHLAEQTAEVDEVLAAYGQRPVDWLLTNHDVDERWCLIHCTQMTDNETTQLAATGAVAGLCPITESSLGDGIFNAPTYLANSGRFGIGSDSNVRISLSEELRTLEYSQRLRDRHRAVLATDTASTGRVLFSGAVAGGAQAVGRKSGSIEVGEWADLLALDGTHVDLEDRVGDSVLDSYVFAGDDRMISDVWSAGRHMVKGGHHVHRDQINRRYRQTMRSLKDRI